MIGLASMAVSFSNTAASSWPSTGRPLAASKAAIACRTFSPYAPSMTPGEKRARSSSTWARIIIWRPGSASGVAVEKAARSIPSASGLAEAWAWTAAAWAASPDAGALGSSLVRSALITMSEQAARATVAAARARERRSNFIVSHSQAEGRDTRKMKALGRSRFRTAAVIALLLAGCSPSDGGSGNGFILRAPPKAEDRDQGQAGAPPPAGQAAGSISDQACHQAPLGEAARTNAVHYRDLAWSPFGREERGWET